MKRINFFGLYIVVAILLVGAQMISRAQSLDSLIDEALRNNPQIRSIQSKVRSLEYKSDAVNAYPAPTLGFEFSQIPTGSANVWNNALSNNLSLSQMFPLGGKVQAMTNVERKNALAEKENYKSYIASITAQIKMSYYTLWLIERKIEIQKQTIALLGEMSESSSASFAINKTPQADVLLLKSEIASEEIVLPRLQRQKESETVRLNKLIGRDLNDTGIVIAGELPTATFDMPRGRLEELLDDMNPDLARMDRMIDMNKAMSEANDREQIPDLMVQGMLMRMPKGMVLTSSSDLSMPSSKTEYMYSLMFSVNLPFAPWSKPGYEAKKEEFSSEIEGIRFAKEDMARDMKSKLKEALIKYQSASESMTLYTESVIPLSEQTVTSQTSAYKNGITNISTVLEANRMLLMNKMNLFMAKADAYMALAEIEMMTGIRLPVNGKGNFNEIKNR